MKGPMKSLHVANQDNSLVGSPAAVLVITSSNPPSEFADMKEQDVLVTAPIQNGELIANFLKGILGPATLRALKEQL